MVADFIKKYFTTSDSITKNWSPVRRTFVQNEEAENILLDTGYIVAGRLENSTIQKLSDLYAQLHNFDIVTGGMFYSVYSRDIEYRKKVHEGINELLKPVYNSLFSDYKVVLNSFIAKVSGPESEFCLHQDSTGIDETKYSNLSVWIPLQDTNMQNGCLCVVPHSHKMFSPYRGISFEPPFHNIENTIRKYLQPIELKRGDILLFDNRLVHNSGINTSGKDRVVVMSGVYPIDAPLISCFKDPESSNSAIELIEQSSDFLLTYPNFKHDCHCRPETGKSIGFVKWDTTQMTEGSFLSLCKKYHVPATNVATLLQPTPLQAALDDRFAK